MIWIPALLLLVIVAAPFVVELRRPRLDPEARQDAPGDLVTLSDGVTHYEWHGPSRGNVVVCIHGLTTPSYVWQPLVQRLTGLGLRVLTYDLYGRGLSDRPPGRQDRAFFLRQLDELLTALEVDRSVTLLGYSMGGAIATAYALDHPERVDRLMLLAPVGLGHKMSRFLTFCAEAPGVGEWAIRLLGAVMHRRGIDRRLTPDPALPDFTDRAATAMDLRGTLPAVLSSLRNMMEEDMALPHRQLGDSGLPVVAVWGAADRIIPLSAMGRLAKINRNARQVELPGATHSLPYTHPDQIMDAFTETLRAGG